MNQELAKTLMEAGFPNIGNVQHRQGRTFLLPDGGEAVYSLGDVAPPENWFVPTLSELIEECGVQLSGLTRDFSPLGTTLGWMAHHPDDSNINAYGSSLKEAVARLWLALHPMNETHQGENRPAA